jgi:hypothetical protein
MLPVSPQVPLMNGDVSAIKTALDTLMKAVNETSVVDMQLVREDLSADLAIAAPIDTPVRNRLARIQGNGTAHSWYKMKSTFNSDGSGSRFLGTDPYSGFFANGALPVKVNENYTHVSAPYKALGDIAEVTIQDQAQGASYKDLMAWRTKVKMLNTALMEEWCIINGNVSNNALFFDGMLTQFTENVVDNGGAQFKLSSVSTSQRLVMEQGGHTRFCVTSTNIKQKFNDLVISTYFGVRQNQATPAYSMLSSGVNVAKWDFGFGECDIIASRMLRATTGSGGGLFQWLNIDHESMDDNGNVIQMVDVLPISAFDLARVTSSTRKLIMEISLLKVSIPQFQGQVINIANPSYAT